ncbi:MAG: hypothetical protein DIU61_003985 [Bacteroidota bacterium]|jgi:hypothetical protein|nr:MAG: hypothetical protein DIU61_05935 [Bacteroidota bacterium]
MKTISRTQVREITARITQWRHWHWLVKYVPLVPVWLWCCLKARNLWFFTTANPGLTFGGFTGESKMEMYRLLPSEFIPKSFLVTRSTPFSTLYRIVTEELTLPVAVKPDVGRMGLMFRRINTVEELREYHSVMRADYIIQEFITYPIEVSVFYYRLPQAARGRITGFVRKEPLTVVGDGTSTLQTLILQSERARHWKNELFTRHATELDVVPARGERFVLSQAFNLSRGALLIDLSQEKDAALLSLFDGLSRRTGLCFGRYDLKCASVDDLKAGKNFSILEFNGAGAEPHHVYCDGHSLLSALKILSHHWNILCRISIANQLAGAEIWGLRDGFTHFIQSEKHLAHLRRLDAATPHASESWSETPSPETAIGVPMVEFRRTQN